MKKTINTIAITTMLIIMVSFIGCQKENNFDSMEIAEQPISVIHYNDGKSQESNMFVFKDMETFKNTAQQLEREYEEWDEAFLEEWGHLDEEAINFKEEEIGYNCEKPLDEFEDEYGFNSLRKMYNILEDEWINHDVLDEKNDPSDKYPWEPFEMSLMGKNGEIKIGNTIYKLENNRHIEIIDGDINKLIALNNGDNNVIDNENVILTEYVIDKSTCLTYGTSTKTYTSGHYRIKTQWRVSQDHTWWGDYVKAKLWSYQYRKRWGKWKWRKTRRNISVRMIGNVSPQYYFDPCNSNPTYINQYKSEYGKDVYKKWSSPASGHPDAELRVILSVATRLKGKFYQSGYGTKERWFGDTY